MKTHFLAFLFSLFFTQTVLAERADRDKPIHLEADRATVEDVNRKDGNRISVFTGNVVLTQGTLLIRADKVVMKEDAYGFRYATAWGDLVSFRQKRDGLNEYIEGWGKRVELDNKTDKIELFRKARLKRGLDEVQGDYISYDMDSEFFQVIGSNERGVETGLDNRVRVVIQPKNKPDNADTDTP
ncbi:lipopolysaccharide export system protein LptA [Nitrosomonas cryotolerans]|uniref:Lipopolysaccharide export system protein LptA n=1 Tax=Nitrosomonas cryotolerans ATCC 49181 TaxID=1131553 RepID=A0A1N6IHC7_9PROT|nr:lipopolysaccharide transport periplasmic protein LptA [Nitrosomonas cryotolerans]SFP96560.1 lipopolysaccharide export system protein LptA [Nitrosomonas cryotolerans]SIO31434.1 lipopolysaccharide export system protein LptA [Nitrosomonas cryotolerans ATCC 49181]